jgi:hypothetical protein
MNPALTHESIFLNLFRFLHRRLPSLSEHCVICDDLLTFPGCLPSICHKALCVFGYEDLGLFADIAALSTANEIVDLLISFLCAAINSQRYSMLLNPYPVIG